MLSAETKRYLAKAMALAQEEDHELLVLNFNRAPDSEGVEVLCSMKDSTPENIAQLAQEALGFFAHQSLIVK